MLTVGASRVSCLLPPPTAEQQAEPKPAPAHLHPATIVPSRQQTQCKGMGNAGLLTGVVVCCRPPLNSKKRWSWTLASTMRCGAWGTRTPRRCAQCVEYCLVSAYVWLLTNNGPLLAGVLDD